MNDNILGIIDTAIREGNLGMIEKLTNGNNELLFFDDGSGSWLHFAAASGNIDIAEYFIKCGLDINKKSGAFEANPLVDAVFEGHIEMVKYLYKKGTKIEAENSKNNALFRTVSNGHFEIAKFLIDKGINIFAKYPVGTLAECDAYDYANAYGRMDIAHYIKDRQIEYKMSDEQKELVKREDVRGMIEAIREDDLQKVKDIIENNKETLHIITDFGSWLHYAVIYWRYEIVKYLIEKGIDINLNSGYYDCGAMAYAAAERQLDIIKLLYENGAKFDTSTVNRNALFHAVYVGKIEIAQFLVENGFDYKIRYSSEELKGGIAYKYSKVRKVESLDAYEFARILQAAKIRNYLKKKLQE